MWLMADREHNAAGLNYTRPLYSCPAAALSCETQYVLSALPRALSRKTAREPGGPDLFTDSTRSGTAASFVGTP